MNTTLSRTMRGDLQALTIITLDAAARRELHITTDKNVNGGLSSDASVYHITPDGRGRVHAFSFRPGEGDFRKTLTYAPKTRATEKAIRTMHAATLEAAAAIEQEARNWYASRTLEESAA